MKNSVDVAALGEHKGRASEFTDLVLGFSEKVERIATDLALLTDEKSKDRRMINYIKTVQENRSLIKQLSEKKLHSGLTPQSYKTTGVLKSSRSDKKLATLSRESNRSMSSIKSGRSGKSGRAKSCACTECGSVKKSTSRKRRKSIKSNRSRSSIRSKKSKSSKRSTNKKSELSKSRS